MENNNKLIAEFMGAATRPKHAYAFLRYDSDWNWLMDVVKEIDSLFGEDDVVNYMINKVHNAFFQFNLDTVYKAVVQFIKEYNQHN